MKRFIGTKLINAKPMMLGEAEKLLGRSMGYKGDIPEDGSVLGYLVEYEGGYQAWSPKDVFEAAYRPIDNMTFGLAIEALKQGEKVARAGWNGKGMWLSYVRYSDSVVAETDIHYHLHNVEAEGLPWIGMKTADNKFVPWLASQTDVLAKDWEIVE